MQKVVHARLGADFEVYRWARGRRFDNLALPR